jgi:hypothetical protein
VRDFGKGGGNVKVGVFTDLGQNNAGVFAEGELGLDKVIGVKLIKRGVNLARENENGEEGP